MGNRLFKRMMQSESDANQIISEKSYQHTAAYAKLTGGGEVSSVKTGNDIRNELLTRAHIQQTKHIDSYEESKLGSHTFRVDDLNVADAEESRQQTADKAQADREARAERRRNRRVGARRGAEVDTGETSTDTKNGVDGKNVSGAEKPARSFQEPSRERFNPYA